MDIHLFEKTILKLPSPIQELNHSIFKEAEIKVYVKRDDLIHPIISGNKWRKLSEYIGIAKENPELPLLSFGGAYSNHLYALAYVGNQLKIQTIGIVRGDELTYTSNPYLTQMHEWGMKLYFVNRKQYKLKNSPLNEKVLLIPEGGYGELGINGIKQLVNEITPLDPTHIITAVGTGTTALGIRKFWDKPIYGILTLNNLAEIQRHENEFNITGNIWLEDYIMGKYAKESDIINNFCATFENAHQVQIEPIYTGKMFYGLYDLIQKSHFPRGSKILALHSGGIKLTN
jgi:1-aminocyclopropane-1-carboxylate deaminase/D-cysteine desulfhydrase-like pyridoxal-dependent ACC family enzyme